MRIELLEQAVKTYKQRSDDIYNVLYCIGGPLNDNIDGYTRKQLKNFFQISKVIEGVFDIDNMEPEDES